MSEKNNSNPAYFGDTKRLLIDEGMAAPSAEKVKETADRLRCYYPDKKEGVKRMAEILQATVKTDPVLQSVNDWVSGVCADAKAYFDAELDFWLEPVKELRDTHTVISYPCGVETGNRDVSYMMKTPWTIRRYFALVPRDSPAANGYLDWEEAKKQYPTLELVYNISAATSATYRHGHKKDE